MKVRGTQTQKPQKLEVGVDTVYIRTNVTRIETEEFIGWEYNEIQLSKNAFIEEVANKSNQLEMSATLTNMEVFGALSAIATSNEVSQAQMMMEIMNMLGQIQGGE